MKAKIVILAAVLLLGLASFSACDDNTPLCLPGSQLECLCKDGTLGTETCAKDGLSYGACCEDRGMGGAGGVGADN
jgi:hypothetical protein